MVAVCRFRDWTALAPDRNHPIFIIGDIRGGGGAMPPRDQLPAIIQPGELATPSDTYIVPALIAELGHQANWRYVEFFTANINNDHTRRAYARACSRFFAWCENRGLSLTAIRPFDVRRGGLGERPAAGTWGAGCEAAAGGRAHAVRLAHYRAY